MSESPEPGELGAGEAEHKRPPFDPHEDVVWYDTIAGAFDPEPDLGYHPGED